MLTVGRSRLETLVLKSWNVLNKHILRNSHEQRFVSPSFHLDLVVNRKEKSVQISNGCKSYELAFESLLDNNKSSFDSSTHQRMENIRDWNEQVDLVEWKSLSDSQIQFVWSDSRTTVFDVGALNSDVGIDPVTWNSSTFSELVASNVQDARTIGRGFDSVGYRNFFDSLAKYGVCLVNNVEPTQDATEEFCKRVGTIIPTFFAEGMWSFTSDGKFADTAYSNIPLRTHTDNCYFDSPSGVQVFHCLHHDGPGGETLLVDGFHIARLLHRSDRHAYQVLAGTPIKYRYVDPGKVACKASGTVIAEDFGGFPRLKQIRYNDYDRDVDQSHLSVAEQKEFYWALKRTAQLIQSEENEVRYKLMPGTVIFIDNWRVMHGRRGFAGRRSMCGCYMDRHDWRNRAALTLN